MKQILLLLICCCRLMQAGSQPGGVQGLRLWIVTEEISPNKLAWVDKLSTKPEYMTLDNTQPSNRACMVNFNRALQFSGVNESLLLPLGQNPYDNATILPVCAPADNSKEYMVWTYEKNAKSQLTVTTEYMADFTENYYKQYDSLQTTGARIIGYAQNKGNSSGPVVRQFLRVGGRPVLPEIQVAPFQGLMPEILIYDRYLSPEDRQKAETYLAIKYGVSMRSSYVNSKGETIWNFPKNESFSNRNAGIARDDISGLDQKQTSDGAGVVTIGAGQVAVSNVANTAKLQNYDAMVWGDNNRVLDWAEKTPGQPMELLRKWLMVVSGHAFKVKTVVQFDTKFLRSSIPAGQTLWLCIDRSGSGNLSAGTVEYYRAIEVNDRGIASFGDVLWDTDRSGNDRFTFCAGPEMMATAWVKPPQCMPSTDGEIGIRAEGGRAPFHFQVTGVDVDFSETWKANDNAVNELQGIKPGIYFLRVSDSEGRNWMDTLLVHSLDAPVAKLAGKYELNANQTLQLDASAGMPPDDFNYHWIGPNDFQSSSPKIIITEPGRYRLLIERAGCASIQEIEISPFLPDNFNSVELFPNPAPDGVYTLVVKLNRVSELTITVNDMAGRSLSTQNFSGDYYYRYTDKITTPGVYMLSLESGNSAMTKKLVVGD